MHAAPPLFRWESARQGCGCGGIKPKSALSSDVGACPPPLIEIASWDRNNDVHVECRWCWCGGAGVRWRGGGGGRGVGQCGVRRINIVCSLLRPHAHAHACTVAMATDVSHGRPKPNLPFFARYTRESFSKEMQITSRYIRNNCMIRKPFASSKCHGKPIKLLHWWKYLFI